MSLYAVLNSVRHGAPSEPNKCCIFIWQSPVQEASIFPSQGDAVAVIGARQSGVSKLIERIVKDGGGVEAGETEMWKQCFEAGFSLRNLAKAWLRGGGSQAKKN